MEKNIFLLLSFCQIKREIKFKSPYNINRKCWEIAIVINYCRLNGSAIKLILLSEQTIKIIEKCLPQIKTILPELPKELYYIGKNHREEFQGES